MVEASPGLYTVNLVEPSGMTSKDLPQNFCRIEDVSSNFQSSPSAYAATLDAIIETWAAMHQYMYGKTHGLHIL